MLAKRLLVVIVLIPIFVALFFYGGVPYAVVINLIMGVAAWEYCRIFRRGEHSPLTIITIVSVLALITSRAIWGFAFSDLIITVIVLGVMAAEVVQYERKNCQAASDFAITLAGIFYIGWIGAFFISVRNLPDGQWWGMLITPAIWFADGAAFTIGRHFGRHKMSPVVSPNKTWEGYLGGVIASGLFTALLAWFWHVRAPAITPDKGLLLGLAISAISPLGDLGESMIKRQFGVKDSSKIIPGHGGVLDRLDSWLWAMAIGYYLVKFF